MSATHQRSTAAPTRPPTPPPAGRGRWTLPIAASASFLAGLDTTAVNLALPDVQRDLDASLGELQWVVNAFALLSATLLVVAGNLSDRFGSRRVFVTGVLAFAASSALCGAARSALVLDLARGAQGAAAAVVLAAGLAVLVTGYVGSERGRAIGLYGSVAALSFVIGPLVGGLLTDTLGWRSVFWANVPIALAIAAAAAAKLPRTERRESGAVRLDPGGLLTFVVGLGGIQYAVLRADDLGWGDPQVLLTGAAGLTGLAAFVALERRSPDGLVDLRLFRSPTFSGAAGAITLAAGAYFGMLVYLSLFLQQTQHYDAFETGLVYLPTILPYIVVSPLSARLVARFPGPTVPAAGCTLIALGMLLLTRTPDAAGLLDVAPAMVVTGIGSGLVVTPLMKLGLDQVPDGRTGMAGGVLQTARPLGVTLGVTVLGLAVPGELDARAFRTVAALAAGLAVLATAIAVGTIGAEERRSAPR